MCSNLLLRNHHFVIIGYSSFWVMESIVDPTCAALPNMNELKAIHHTLLLLVPE